MECSTRFLPFSDKAGGIAARLFALIGAYIAYQQIYYSDTANPEYELYFWVFGFGVLHIVYAFSNTIDTNF